MKRFILLLWFILLSNSLFAQNLINYFYDNLYRVTSAVYPDSSIITYTYDNNGNRVTKRVQNPCSTKPRPVISASGVTLLCIGDSVTLTTATGLQYRWSNGDTIHQSITVHIGGSYKVTKLDTFRINSDTIQCYLTSDSINVTVSASPYVAAISGASTVEVYSAITLSDSISGGTWTSSNPGIATVDSYGVVIGHAIGTANITYSVAFSCGAVNAVKTITVTASPSPNIYTFAGNGIAGYSGDGGFSIAAELNGPYSIIPDNSGNLFISDNRNYRVRKIDATGKITTIAGNGTSGYSGDGGPAISAQFSGVKGITLDSYGNLFVADEGNNCIRKIIASTGIITTVAGNGTSGYSGDGGPAISAQFSGVKGITLDSYGNLFVADEGNNCIRKIIASTGIITTVAGNGIIGSNGDGGPATAAELNNPLGVAIDSMGNLFISDLNGYKIRKVNTSGIIATVAGNGSTGFSGDGGPATAANIGACQSIAIDNNGNILLSEIDNRIRKVNTSGIITTIAGIVTNGYTGDGGPAINAQFYEPVGISCDNAGNIYVADWYNNVIRIIGKRNYAPFFSNGATQNLNICGNVSAALNSFLSFRDIDTGQTETLSVSAAPLHGSLVGFPFSILATGSAITPTGLTYTPASGYSGSDSFSIQVSDGLKTTVTKIYITISSVPSITLGPIAPICMGDTVAFLPYTATTGSPVNYSLSWSSPALAQGFENIGNPENIITTIAGSGIYGYSGDGSAASATELYGPSGVAIDFSGNIYVADADNKRIRKISTSGIISTVAGNGITGFSGDGGAATLAEFSRPSGIAVDSIGNLYIVDEGNQRIRKVNTSGIISTVAGNGYRDYLGYGGYSGDGGDATLAELNWPTGVAVDIHGNLYIADQYNYRIRKVDISGIISTVAGNGVSGNGGDGGQATDAQITANGVFVDKLGGIYIANGNGDSRIRKVNNSGIINTIAGNGIPGDNGDGGPATAAELYNPCSVSVDNDGNIFIPEMLGNRIRKVNTSGVISTVAGTGFGAGTGYGGFSGDGGAATLAELDFPVGVAVDRSGNFYIADQYNQRIRKVDTTGLITTFAGVNPYSFSGDGGAARMAQLNGPYGIAIDAVKNIFIADYNNNVIRKVSPSGVITRVAGNGFGAGIGVGGYSGDGGLATAAELWAPWDVVVDSFGNLYIADQYNARIRKVSTTGIITTIAGNGTGGHSGDGGPATAAQIGANGVAIDRKGNIYICEGYCIRKVNTSGVISTIAGISGGVGGDSGDGGPATSATMRGAWAVAIDTSGNLFIADWLNNRVRKVNTSGIISSIAGSGTYGTNGYNGDGGAATAAQLFRPFSIVVDAGGNIYFSDCGNNVIRKVDTAGIISTFAGNGIPGFSGDDSTATLAELNGPYGLAVDKSNNVYISDVANNRIRKVNIGAIAPLPASPIHLKIPGTASPSTYDGLLSVSNGFCTSTTYPYSVNINSLPSLLPGLSTICAGSLITLSDTVRGGTWRSSNMGVATVDSTGKVTGIIGGTATISYNVTNACGTDTLTTAVLVNSSPSITLGTIPPICTGDTVLSIPYTSSSGGLMYNITWDSAALAQGFSNIGGTGSIITTIAGNGTAGYSGDGEDAPAAELNNPYGVTFDSSGNIFFTDRGNNVIRKVNISGIITTVAGNGTNGSGGEGGLATAAQLDSPEGISIDGAGNLFFTDNYYSRIRKVDTSGILTSVAGSWGNGYGGDGGGALYGATLSTPSGVVVDNLGNFYIADVGNNRIRKVNTSGIITTIAGNGTNDYTGDGGPATNAGIGQPQSIALDNKGNIYIGDYRFNVIRKIDSSGIISTFAGIAALFSSNTGDGEPAISAGISSPNGIAVDNYGNVFITTNQVVRKVNTSGIITTVAGNGLSGFSGDGLDATSAKLNYPTGVSVDKSGNLFIADVENNRIRKISSGNSSLPVSPIRLSAPGNATPGTYTGSITVFNGTCGSTTYPFAVNVNPVPTFITGLSSVCMGAFITLTDTASGGSWSSSFPSMATVSGGIVTGIAQGVDTIIYTYPTACGTGMAKAIITVNPTPSAIIGASSICSGFTTALIDSGGGIWSSSTPAHATVSNTGTVTGLTPGTTNIAYSFPTGCSVTKTVTVNPLPATISGIRNVCVGSTTSLSDATLSGVWSTNNQLIAIVDSGTGIVSGVSSGVTNITFKLATGCLITTPFTVKPLPGSINGGTNVCAGHSITLTDSTLGGAWSSSNTSLATVNTSGIVTGLSGGSPTISFSLPTGCSAIKTVTINPLPASITGTANICLGLTTTLIDLTSFGTWSSSDTTIASVSESGIVIGETLGTSVVTYTLPTGCTASKTVTINPFPLPINGIDSVCEGSTITLIDTTADGIWSSSNAALAIVNVSGTVMGLSAGTLDISYTLPTGCSVTKSVKVNPLPDSITGTASICLGLTTAFVDLTPFGTWGSSNTAIASVSDSGIVTSITLGISDITYTLPTGCTVSKTITVNPYPSLMNGVFSVCTGATTTLNDTTTGGTWSSSDTTLATVNISGIVLGVAAGSPYISYKLPTGCSIFIEVTVNPMPSAITGPTNVCVGFTTTFSDSTPLGIWYSSDTSIARIDSIGIVNGLASGSVNITYSLFTGCKVLKTITVSLIPVISTLVKNVKCFGENSGTINVTASVGQPPFMYSLDALPFTTVDSFINLLSGNYIVHVKDILGCTSQKIVSLSQPAAPLSATFMSSNSNCYEDKIGTITTSANGGTPPYTYIINNGTPHSGVFDSLVAGNYIIKVSDSNNCKVYDTIMITQPPQIIGSVANITLDDCYPVGTGSITISATGGVSPIQYANNGGNYQISSTFSSLVAGQYTITAKDNNGCIYLFQTLTLPNTKPENGWAIVKNNFVLKSPYSLPCNWYIAGNTNPIDSGLSHLWNQFGYYYVIGIDSNGCVATSDTIHISNSNTIIEVFPNPATSSATINCIFSGSMPVNIKMYNSIGQVVETFGGEQPCNGYFSTKFLTSKFASGDYLIKVIIGDDKKPTTIKTIKFVIE